MVALIIGMLVCLGLAIAVVGLVAVPARREGRDVLTPRGEEVVGSFSRDRAAEDRGKTPAAEDRGKTPAAEIPPSDARAEHEPDPAPAHDPGGPVDGATDADRPARSA